MRAVRNSLLVIAMTIGWLVLNPYPVWAQEPAATQADEEVSDDASGDEPAEDAGDTDEEDDSEGDTRSIIPDRTLDDLFVPSEEIKADSEISFPSDI